MTSITARIPQIDWNNGFDRNWYGGNAAVTHAFNALSFLFPQGEKFFIDVAQEVAGTLDLTNDAELRKAVKGFTAQESVHGYQHSRYNEVLQAQGVWGWHSAEETEHKAVCFDLYHAAGGGWARRAWMFVLVSVNFYLMFNRLYFSLLWRDGCLRPGRVPKTMGQAMRFFFGSPGVGWYLARDGLRYLSPGFHPWNQENRMKMQSWFAANQAKLRDVAVP